jgi:hypothetical protein
MRRFPGAIALGLLAACLAHTVVYGNDHVMGGAYGSALRALAAAAGLGFGVFWLAVCLASRGRLCQGSMLSASISRFLPSLTGVFAASLGWFWLAESVEEGHAWAPAGYIVLALLVAAALVRVLTSVGLRALARIVFACDSGGFKHRTRSWTAIPDRPILGVPMVRALRLFSRPPPNSFNH